MYAKIDVIGFQVFVTKNGELKSAADRVPSICERASANKSESEEIISNAQNMHTCPHTLTHTHTLVFDSIANDCVK